MSTHMSDWFGARRWRVFTEASGTGAVPGENGPIPVYFSSGHFTVEAPGAFLSPLGNAGRKGVVLQEVDADGKDIPGADHLVAFGEAVVAKAGEAIRA